MKELLSKFMVSLPIQYAAKMGGVAAYCICEQAS